MLQQKNNRLFILLLQQIFNRSTYQSFMFMCNNCLIINLLINLASARVIMHQETQQQQLFSSNNMASNVQPCTLHSSANHQQAILATCYPMINITVVPTSSVINLTILSTPISTGIRKGSTTLGNIGIVYSNTTPISTNC